MLFGILTIEYIIARPERLSEVFRNGGVTNINSFLHLIASDQI